MRGDPHPAAVRLCERLPVRTHERRAPPPYVPGSKKPLAVTIDGITYPSAWQAKCALKIGTNKLHAWIREGKAIRHDP